MRWLLNAVIVLGLLALIANRYLPDPPQARSLIGDSPAAASAPDECRIKGNISMNGERIYHLPGRPYYDETRIDPTQGERWFCSEEQARAAGWRKSRAY